MAKELIKAPIDNKNIVEDFADVFHNGEFVEYAKDKFHKQLFYIGDEPFELSYYFGDSFFAIKALDGIKDMSSINVIRDAVKSLNTDHVFVKYGESGKEDKYLLCGTFYFVES